MAFLLKLLLAGTRSPPGGSPAHLWAGSLIALCVHMWKDYCSHLARLPLSVCLSIFGLTPQYTMDGHGLLKRALEPKPEISNTMLNNLLYTMYLSRQQRVMFMMYSRQRTRKFPFFSVMIWVCSFKWNGMLSFCFCTQ